MTEPLHLKSGFIPSVLLCAFAAAASAQAPLEVIGVTDKAYNTYSGQASFRVPSTSGYTYRVLLDGVPVPTDVTNLVANPDYHEVSVWRTNVQTGLVTNRLVRFIVTTPGRGVTENGIPTHFPLPVIPSGAQEFAEAGLRLIVPQDFPIGYEIPVVAWVVNADGHAVRANGSLQSPGHPSIAIKRGVGSGFLAASNPSGELHYDPQIQGLQTNRTINLEASTTWTTVSGYLNGAINWPDNARINVNGHLLIPAGSTLTIGAGAIVRLNPGINITNNGAIVIQGTLDRPVVFMPNSRATPWGGFFMRTSTGSIDGTGVIFTGCGADPNGGAGHRPEQCLFLVDSTPRISLTDSAAIYMAGQLGHAYAGGTFNYTRFLMQRCITGGEYTGASFTANDSAFIECPDDSVNFVDGDNDGLYFVSGSHAFTNTLFGWTKDDGIDSGGSGYGPLRYQNCWFEATTHEGNSLSGYKDTRAWDTVYMNCGQGIEDGYNAPTGRVDRCFFTGNQIGVRHGDNYDNIGAYDGRMIATNSVFLQNHRDVWGYNWRAAGWTNAVGQMIIHSNLFAVENTNFPANAVWSPAADFARLTNWMTIPHLAAVGVGLAVRSNEWAMTNIFLGVPVRLSSFTTNAVSVDYVWFTDAGPLATGTLAFAPGESVGRVFPGDFNTTTQTVVQLRLQNPVNAELTGETNLVFQGNLATPKVSLGVATNLLAGYRLAEGTFLRLNTPSTERVRVAYRYEAAGLVLFDGVAIFEPTQTSQQLFLTNVEPSTYSLIHLSLSNPTGAALGGITSLSFTNPALAMSFAVATNQFSLDTLASGVVVGLTAGAPNGTSVEFAFEGTGGVLTNGVLNFAVGQSSILLTAPTINPAAHELIRVSLRNATGVPLMGVTNVFFVHTVLPPPASVTLIASNAVWRYRDAASAAPANWATNSFDDSTWPQGSAQLGFSNNEENDEATLIADNNQITSYFRRSFVVADPSAYTNLALWLLRDDGGVVYLNGREIFRTPNLPAAPTAITYSTTTGTPNGENTIDLATVGIAFLQSGTNVVAAEIHQQSATSSDVSFALELAGFNAPQPPQPQSVSWGQFDGQLNLVWGDGAYRLQEADFVNGPWTNSVSGSPFVVTPDKAQKFYRLRK